MRTYHGDKLGQVTIPEGEVAQAFACPSCGENGIDSLVWQDYNEYEEDVVCCATCGLVYAPLKRA